MDHQPTLTEHVRQNPHLHTDSEDLILAKPSEAALVKCGFFCLLSELQLSGR